MRCKVDSHRCVSGCIILSLTIAAGLFYSGAVAQGNENESARERFLKEAPQKWLEYRQNISRHTEGKYQLKVFNITSGRTEVNHANFSFIVNLDHKSFCSKNAKSISAQNPNYSFEIFSRNDKWFIGQLYKSDKDIPSDLIGRDDTFSMVKGESGNFGRVFHTLCMGQTLWKAWFPLMLEAHAFKLKSVEYLDSDKKLVRVEFEFEPGDFHATGSDAPCRSGFVVLDTSRYWLICEAETAMTPSPSGRGTFKVKNKFSDGTLQVHYISHQVRTLSWSKTEEEDAGICEWVFDIEMHDALNIDKKQFMLSNIGISEPVDDLDGKQFDITPESVDLGDITPEARRLAEFTITNNSDKAIRILGCEELGNSSMNDKFPITLEPKESRVLSADVWINNQEDSFQQIALFVDDGKLHTVGLSIRAQVGAAEESRR